MAHRGAARGRPELSLQGELVDLDHDAVDLVVEVVAVLLPVAAEGEHLVEAVDHLVSGFTGKPHAQRGLGAALWRATRGTRPSHAPPAGRPRTTGRAWR